MIFKRATVLTVALLVLMSCVQDPRTAAERLPRDLSECPRDTTSACFFVNSPVRLAGQAVRLPGRANPFFYTARTMEFVDGAARTWAVPKRTLTDGASIPLIFVPIVGSPTSPEFVNAAAVHDAHCGIGNEAGPVYHSKTWQETHRMFYDTLIVGGTPAPKAKLMFAAVWLGGPRWYAWNGRTDLTMERVPAALRVAAMRETRDYIAQTDPTLLALLAYLIRLEAKMLRVNANDTSDGASGLAPTPALPDEVSNLNEP